jgi:ribonuclease HI
LASAPLSLSELTKEMLMNQVWTDGACEPNPGTGGWGYLLQTETGLVREDCGGEIETTNNRMELTAILMALKALPDGAMAVIYSDSQYCVNGMTVWSKGWKRRQWHKKDGSPMPNRDLWLALNEADKRVRATYKWVRGHAGNAGNERADVLASIGRRGVLS